MLLLADSHIGHQQHRSQTELSSISGPILMLEKNANCLMLVTLCIGMKPNCRNN